MPIFHPVPKNGLPRISGKWLSFTRAFKRLRGGRPCSSSWGGLRVGAAWTSENQFPEALGVGSVRLVRPGDEGAHLAHFVF